MEKARGLDHRSDPVLAGHFHSFMREQIGGSIVGQAATTMAPKLSNVLELAAITGHKSLSMLQIYYKPKAADLAARLDAYECGDVDRNVG